jgi:Inner membrane component of T3SS, cytoplasmic domain/Domain of unknown function (DUF4389)
MAGARLVIVEGPDAGKEFDVSASTTVGREGDVVLNDSEVSRRHATLSFDGSAVTVADLGSTNGTFVNEERVDAARQLGPGDRLRIGTTVFELRLPDAEDIDATRQRPSPDLASAPPPSGPPGGAGGVPGGAPPPSEPPAGGPPPGMPPPSPGGPPPPAYTPPSSPPPGGPPAPYYAGGLGTAYPAVYEVDYPTGGIARWRPFFQWLLAIPNFFVLWFVFIAAAFAFIGAWFAILFTRRYPPGIFNFLVGTLRWTHRVTGYSYLMTEQYPPFSLEDSPYPIRVRVDYPQDGIARWRPLLQYIMALPHLFVLYFLGIAVALGLFVAWFAILFTRNYPPGIFNFVNGVIRWQVRVQAYIFLMTEQYPPFSLD